MILTLNELINKLIEQKNYLGGDAVVGVYSDDYVQTIHRIVDVRDDDNDVCRIIIG